VRLAPGTLCTELWVSATQLGDVLTEHKRLDGRLKDIALSVGITDEQWFAIKRADVRRQLRERTC
jgi:hypothetical protein